jgi:transcriptional regulator with XRE-family HTH domain
MYMTDPENISAEDVRRLREARGWSQEQLAAICGLSSQSVVSNFERGLRPSDAVSRRLREALAPAVDAYDAPRQATTPPEVAA